ATAAALTATATALLSRRLAKVTGERWPLPAGWLAGMVDSSPPYEVENYPSSPPRTDNSNRRAASGSDNSNWRTRSGGAGTGVGWALAVRLAGGGTVAAARPLGSALSRTWWPAAIPAALAVRKLRLPVAALICTPPLLDWAARKPPLDPARYVAARLLDDAAYSLGVWQGCLARRTARPLLPLIGGRGIAGQR
ncbi:MAG: hypothetical protein ACRDNW_07750, partial [Trebonia sp.]